MNRPTCGECRFWSQMVAQSMGAGPMTALCLAQGGPRSKHYTTSGESCHGHKPDTFGKVDDPPNYGELVRAEYLSAEGPEALQARGEA